jgi:hypothetical protein
MKNLVNKISDVEQAEAVENLYDGKNLKQDKSHYRSIYHTVDGISLFKRIKYIIESNIGKSFDIAFSNFCEQVPVYQQKFFMQEFDKKRWQNYCSYYYYIDKQGNIQKYKEPRLKQKAIFYSDDYLKENNEVISGFKLEFSSVKDPEYIRLTTEQRKRRKKANKEYQKQKEKTYSFKNNDISNSI